jgi:hypothetical protein
MSLPHRSHYQALGIAVMLAWALVAPVAAQMEDQVIAPGSSVESRSPDFLPAALSLGTRWGVAQLAPLPLPADAASVNPSDDRIASALFGDEASGAGIRQPVAIPSLTDVSATTQTPRLFTVTGNDFTSGGRVYLAIYDQMGAQLYETRWITASLPLLALMGPTGHEAASLPGFGRGGTLREAFADLCGATAMMRAFDLDTDTWSTWLTVEPACAAYVEPTAGPH